MGAWRFRAMDSIGQLSADARETEQKEEDEGEAASMGLREPMSEKDCMAHRWASLRLGILAFPMG